MTITVAALWPWEPQHFVELWKWNKLLGTPDKHFPPRPTSVILLSDSRWTYPDHVEDTGTKLFQIARNAGAMYAGDVPSGERSLLKLGGRFMNSKVEKPYTKMTRNIIKNEYTYTHDKDEHPLGIVVGACTDIDGAELWGFNSERNFTPQRLGGVQVRAPNNEIKERFFEGLKQVIEDTPPDGPFDLTVGKGALWLSMALQHFVLEADLHESIGGKMQAAIIHEGKFEFASFGTFSRENIPKLMKRYTPLPGDLTTLEPWAGKRKRRPRRNAAK